MTSLFSTLPAPLTFVVRLLNGPLCGCEYRLSAPRTLFLVGQEQVLMPTGSPPVLPADTLYIPLASGGLNFELLIAPELPDGVALRVLDKGPSSTPERPLNVPFKVGNLRLAIRAEHTAWSSSVACYPEDEHIPGQISRGGKPIIAILLGTLMLLAAGSYWLWPMAERQTETLLSLMGNQVNRFQVIPGRDGTMYVISTNERDRSWALQVLARGDYPQPAIIISPAQENERIATWLANHYPELAYYRLELDNPRQPQLWISQQRSPLAAATMQALSQQLGDQLPYADQVMLVPVDDTVAVNAAENGLSRQALPFIRRDQRGSVTFLIQGELNDGELLRAQRFVEDYVGQWGTRYVQFAIELTDDLLKGNSFKYGRQGYVKLAPGHWYFPNNR